MHVEFAGMTMNNTKKIKFHSHSHWEILYYFSGNGVLCVGDKEIAFGPGDIICQPPNIPHSEYSEKGFYNIYLQVSDFKPPVQNIIPQFKDTINSDIYNITMFLYREFHLKNKGWQYIIDELFLVLYRFILSQNPDILKNNYVEDFKNILISNISNTYFRIDDANKKIPLSSYYLKRLFKRETGETPLQYLTLKRISYSKLLLENRFKTSMSVKEIARLSGFDDPYYFSRVFKKNTGCCPSDWI